MSSGPEENEYAQRQAIVDRISAALSSNPDDGLAQLRSEDAKAAPELKRDLLAMAWRVGTRAHDPKLRRGLVHYHLDVIAGGSSLLEGQALKFLLDFSPNDCDAKAVETLEKLPLSGDYGSESIRLVGVMQVRSRIAELQAIGDKLATEAFHASPAWAASLALARMGDGNRTRRVIEQVQRERDIIIRATRLFADLAYTRQPAAFDALRGYLHSEERLPRVKDNVPGTQEAKLAAVQFALHVEGCPVSTEDVEESDLPAIRRWADAQTVWRPVR